MHCRVGWRLAHVKTERSSQKDLAAEERSAEDEASGGLEEDWKRLWGVNDELYIGCRGVNDKQTLGRPVTKSKRRKRLNT